MIFLKEIRRDDLGHYVRIRTAFSTSNSMYFDRFATCSGQLTETSDYGSCEEQAKFLMSQVPDDFPLLPRELEALDAYRYKIVNYGIR